MRTLMRAAVLLVACMAPVVVAHAPATAQADVAVDPTTLDETPVLGGGVRGFVQPSVPQNWRVHAFAQIGDRIFVGGAFTEVRERPWGVSPTHPQAFLAAFDLETNDYIAEFAPVLDDAVWALAVHNGNLVVGGEFDSVNGIAREGLVTLDPTTGDTVSSFAASIGNEGTVFEGSVRALERIGDDLYVVGDYNRIRHSGTNYGFNRVARLDATTGAPDLAWQPWPFGGGVFDIAVDTANAKAFIVGSFTSVNGSIETNNLAAVNLVDGGTVPGHPRNPQNRSNIRTYGVDLLGPNVFVGGEQHYVEVHDRADWAQVACMVSGYGTVDSQCGFIDRGPNWPGAGLGGGDYQVIEEIDGFVVTGCHCRWLLFNSATQQYLNLQDRGVRLYDQNGIDIDFWPGATIWNEGPYAAFGDSRGCLYLGGDFTGTVDGFARYCTPETLLPFGPPDAVATVAGDSVAIDWSASADTKGYLVHRDGVFVQFSTGPGFEAAGLADGTYRYDVRAQRPDNTYSAPTTLTVTIGDAEVLSPPADLAAVVNGTTVNLTWSEVPVANGYLVHQDWNFVAYTTEPSYAVVDVEPGRRRFEVRAQTPAGENSTPALLLVDVAGPPDDTAPTTPTGLTATLEAGSVGLAWNAAADDVGVTGYLVHRNWNFLAYVTTTSMVDEEPLPGARNRYQVRAQDAAGNNSAPTPIAGVDVP